MKGAQALASQFARMDTNDDGFYSFDEAVANMGPDAKLSEHDLTELIPPKLRADSGLGSIRPHILAAMGRLMPFQLHKPPRTPSDVPIPPIKGDTVTFYDKEDFEPLFQPPCGGDIRMVGSQVVNRQAARLPARTPAVARLSVGRPTGRSVRVGPRRNHKWPTGARPSCTLRSRLARWSRRRG